MPLPLSFSQWCVTPSDHWNDDENYADDHAHDNADNDADVAPSDHYHIGTTMRTRLVTLMLMLRIWCVTPSDSS